MEEKKSKLIEYASLKAQASRIEDAIEMMKPEIELIVSEINPADNCVEVSDVGTFSLACRRKYSYTPPVGILEKRLKDMKKEEEATGAASYEETRYLLFKSSVIN